MAVARGSIDEGQSACRPAGWVCPACRSGLSEGDADLCCTRCGRTFPVVAGLPDLRLAPDRYLGLDEERAKARRLAGIEPGTDVLGLAEAYYAMTADVDARRRARYLAHLARAEDRGRALIDLLPSRGRILEIGCGSGGLLAAAARAGLAIEGVDIALRWLVIARRRLADLGLRVPLLGASAGHLPWPEATFDAVVADSLLEHVGDPGRVFGECARVLRPGGRLIVWSPNRYALSPDPHVGLWGVGWLPRAWAPAYVRLGRGCDWPVRPLSAAEASRLARSAGLGGVRVEAPALSGSWAPGRTFGARLALRAYDAGRRMRTARGCLLAFGPLWQLTATKGGAA